MRANLLTTSLRVLTWCCVILLPVLSLLPAQHMVRTGFPGRLEHFVACAGSAAIAMAGYGASRGGMQITLTSGKSYPLSAVRGTVRITGPRSRSITATTTFEALGTDPVDLRACGSGHAPGLPAARTGPLRFGPGGTGDGAAA